MLSRRIPSPWKWPPIDLESVYLIASVLSDISENEWALVNLSVRESALEEIYVKLMTE